MTLTFNDHQFSYTKGPYRTHFPILIILPKLQWNSFTHFIMGERKIYPSSEIGIFSPLIQQK